MPPVNTPRIVAVTGAAGSLGSVLRAHFAEHGVAVRSMDLRAPAEPYAGEVFVRCDLADGAAVTEALKGVDAVVHLGGISTVAPFDKILAANIVGTHHVYEAARMHGIRRVVFASSNHVTGYYRSDAPVTPDMPRRPDSFYGVSKAFGEDLARMYFDKYGVESVCLRIGSCFERPTDRRMLKTWLSHADFIRLVEAALQAQSPGYQVVYGVSDNAQAYWPTDTGAGIGFAPRDSSAEYAGHLAAADQKLEPTYQGGQFTEVDETATPKQKEV